MRIPQRSTTELAAMRRAGRVVAEMHEVIGAAIRPGATTAQLDQLGRDVLSRRGAHSNFLGYHGFPAVICASVNSCVIHGIPNDVPLEDGDIVGIDCGAIVDGWHGDAAFTAGVGTISVEARALITATQGALDAAIAQMLDGNRVGDVSAAVEAFAVRTGYSIVEGYGGHGIGRAMHEGPDVPNEGRAGRGPQLRTGVVLAIEPMLTLGGPDTDVLDDGWTVVTLDGSLGAHAEHTVLVGPNGPEVLTRVG